MPESKTETKEKLEAAAAIVDALSVKDATQPIMKQVGEAGSTVLGVLRTLLIPLDILNAWGESKKNAFIEAMTEKINSISEENKLPPKKRLLTGALQGAILAEEDDETMLRNMYLNLLSASMDKEQVINAHPAFVEIITQMSSDEARIMRLFAQRNAIPAIDIVLSSPMKSSFFGLRGHSNEPDDQMLVNNFTTVAEEADCKVPEALEVAFDNLIRLQLIEIRNDYSFKEEDVYFPLENHPRILEAIKAAENNTNMFHVAVPMPSRKLITLTQFGKCFCNACVISYQDKTESHFEGAIDTGLWQAEEPLRKFVQYEAIKIIKEFEDKMAQDFSISYY